MVSDPFESHYDRQERERPDPCPELWAGTWNHSWPQREIDRVTPDLFLGSSAYRDREVHEGRLITLGVGHVLDVRTVDECRQDKLRIPEWCDLRRIPTADDYRPKSIEWFETIFRWALPILEAKGKIYVHCTMGVNRGPSALYAILRARDSKLSSRDAMALIRTARPIAAACYWRDADDAIRALYGR